MTVEVTGPVTFEDVDAMIELMQAQVEYLPGGEAASLLSRMTESSAKWNAYRVALVSRVESSQVWRESEPNATAASYLRQELVADHGEVKAALRAADSFDRFPELAKACREGRLSSDKMDLILRIGRRNPQREAALPEFLSIFIELAQRVPLSQLRQALELWSDQVDAVTTAGDERDAHQRRELYVTQVGDGVKLDGFFGKEQGLRLMTALNGVLDRQWRAEHDPNNTGHATKHADTPIASSTAAQRADAFIGGIIDPILQEGLVPSAGGAAATVCVTVPLHRLTEPSVPSDLDEVKARLFDGTLRHGSATLRATNGPGETVISAQLAVRMSCDATVQRVVLSPAGKPLDIGRRTRVIPEQIRTALIVRDGGCRFPFCTKPAGWTQGHHIQHWSKGGPTSLDNLVLLCQRHHDQVHAENIPITFTADGIPRLHLEHHFKDRL